MEQCIKPFFSKLPKEIINFILEYSDVVVYRNGVYINRINKGDNRYNIIRAIRMPIIGYSMTNLQLFNISSNLFIYLSYYYGENNKTTIVYNFINSKTNKKTSYNVSNDGKIWKTVNYNM